MSPSYERKAYRPLATTEAFGLEIFHVKQFRRNMFTIMAARSSSEPLYASGIKVQTIRPQPGCMTRATYWTRTEALCHIWAKSNLGSLLLHNVVVSTQTKKSLSLRWIIAAACCIFPNSQVLHLHTPYTSHC